MNVEKTLNKLDGFLGKNKQKKKVDYREINEQRKKSFLKLKNGKNQVAFLIPLGAEDPFVCWGYHSGLQEVAWYSTPCNAYNKGEHCTVCSIIEDLKKENYEKNKHIWLPIRQQTEVYAPVINLASPETIAEGAKWLKISKTALSQLTEWLKNLEKGEEPFFSLTEPQKVIITYTEDALPLDKYKLDRKNMAAFGEVQIEEWLKNLKPINELIQSRSEEQIKKITDDFFARLSEEVAPSTDDDATGGDTPHEEPSEKTIVEEKASSKLGSLKKVK